jgi:hypothetical protein
LGKEILYEKGKRLFIVCLYIKPKANGKKHKGRQEKGKRRSEKKIKYLAIFVDRKYSITD